jgi:hypothetical protein
MDRVQSSIHAGDEDERHDDRTKTYGDRNSAQRQGLGDQETCGCGAGLPEPGQEEYEGGSCVGYEPTARVEWPEENDGLVCTAEDVIELRRRESLDCP